MENDKTEREKLIKGIKTDRLTAVALSAYVFLFFAGGILAIIVSFIDVVKKKDLSEIIVFFALLVGVWLFGRMLFLMVRDIFLANWCLKEIANDSFAIHTVILDKKVLEQNSKYVVFTLHGKTCRYRVGKDFFNNQKEGDSVPCAVLTNRYKDQEIVLLVDDVTLEA